MPDRRLPRLPSRQDGLKHATLLITSAAFFLGLILQPALGQAFDSQLKVPEKLLFVTSLIVAYTLVVAINALILREKKNQSTMEDMVRVVENLELRTGLSVEFLRRGDATVSSDPYQVVTDLVTAATSEILVLDHRPVRDFDRFGSNSTLDDEARREYYDLFTKKATERQPNGQYIRYRRVVQLDQGPTSVWDSSINQDTVFAEHCKSLVKFRASQVQCPSAIKTSTVFFPNASIVVVDGILVLLELAITGPDGAARVQGDLVFRDPQGLLAGPLRQLFENIDSQSILVSEVS